ncbi:PIN domain-containing protein [Methylobacterium sp. SD274]|uniref:type II toxin-antitoxin system VapC family toxin n=1 Tax=Methylobacterium sp. SD274 TaxID=2782009 RepID=UPI001A95842D|nr:PIN domain-containing protein [Methylobacterium sp. SD274]MBO1021877.1 PIN domain-containing protein [Methylobacterium sp. SD274]
MGKPLKIYWDTCAWLGLLNGEPDKKRELEIVYDAARKGRYQLWTSALAIVEARRLNVEKNDPKPLSAENEEKIARIFKQEFVMTTPLDLDVANKARALWRLTVGLGKFQDAVHIASAQKWNISLMHTYDNDDILPLNGNLFCRNGDALVICYPDETTDGPLFKKEVG